MPTVTGSGNCASLEHGGLLAGHAVEFELRPAGLPYALSAHCDLQFAADPAPDDGGVSIAHYASLPRGGWALAATVPVEPTSSRRCAGSVLVALLPGWGGPARHRVVVRLPPGRRLELESSVALSVEALAGGF
jgi:hypothetical protein